MSKSLSVAMTSDERILHLTKQPNGECFHATTPRRAVVHAVAEELHVPARAIVLYDHVEAVTSEEDLNKPLGDDFLDDAARFQCKVVVAQDNLRPHEFPIASREPTSTTTTALLKCSYPDCPTLFSPQTTSLSGQEGCSWYRHRCGHLMCGSCQEKRSASFADEENQKHDTIVCPLCCVRTKRFSSVRATVVGAQGNENEEAHEALKAAKGSRFARLEAIMEQTLCKLHEGCRSPAVVCEKFGIPACQDHFNELQTENRSKKRPVCTSPCSLNASDVLLVHGSCGNQRADLYCHTCAANVCVYCARVDHGEGHKVTTLASAFEADTGALVGQRWGCMSQWLHNIEHAAHAAEEYQARVEDEHHRNIETIRTMTEERKEFTVRSFAKERAHIEEMLQELNQKETELLEKDDAHMQEMKNSADAEATKALRDIETYVRQLALLQSELLDSHVGLTQISASAPLQLFLKNNKLTDYVSETRFSSRVEELHVSTWTPVPPTLPPLIRYKPSNKMAEGGFCDVSIGFARSLPAVTTNETVFTPLPSMTCVRGAWGSLTTYEVGVSMLHCLRGLFVESEAIIQDAFNVRYNGEGSQADEVSDAPNKGDSSYFYYSLFKQVLSSVPRQSRLPCAPFGDMCAMLGSTNAAPMISTRIKSNEATFCMLPTHLRVSPVALPSHSAQQTGKEMEGVKNERTMMQKKTVHKSGANTSKKVTNQRKQTPNNKQNQSNKRNQKPKQTRNKRR